MGVYILYKLRLSQVYGGITANQIFLSPMTPGANPLMDNKEQRYMYQITELTGKLKPLFLFITQKQYMLPGCEKKQKKTDQKSFSPGISSSISSVKAFILLRFGGKTQEALLHSTLVLVPSSQVRQGDVRVHKTDHCSKRTYVQFFQKKHSRCSLNLMYYFKNFQCCIYQII